MSFQNHRIRDGLISIVFLAVGIAPLVADEPLTARRVIAETQAAINASENDTSWSKATLAAAQTYLGDRKESWITLGPFKAGETLVWSGYLSCAEAEIALSGTYTPLPQGVIEESPDVSRFSLAKAYAQRGDGKRAIKLLSEIPANGFVTNKAAKELVPILLASGQHGAARKVLELQSKCYSTAWHTMTFDAGAEELVRRLVEMGEKPAATSFCHHWEGLLQTATDPKKMGSHIGQTWAKLGFCYRLAGDEPAAKQAMQQAGYWFEEALKAREGEVKPIHLLNNAEAIALIAARQRFVLGDDIAKGTYERAYGFADGVVSTHYGYWGYVKIVDKALEVDDIGGARLALDRVQSPLDRAKCRLKLAEYYVERSSLDDAVANASEGLNHLKKAPQRAGDFDTAMRLAKCLALAKELAASREAFRYAKELSALEENDYHSMIARWEIQAGLLSDAYATIQAVGDSTSRTLPLAELARELAKKEAFAPREGESPAR